MKLLNKHLFFLVLFFILTPFFRIFFHPFAPVSPSSIQLIPFIVLNKYTIRIYLLNYFIYLLPGYLYFQYTSSSHSTLKNKLQHFFFFFLICFLTKILYFIFKIGVFDMSTVIIQNIAILSGYIIAYMANYIISKLCCNK